VYFNTLKNRWMGQLDLGQDLAGRRVRPTVSGRTRTEVRAKLDALRAQHEAGHDVAERSTTFADLARQFFNRGLTAELSENTREEYRGIVDRHLLPALGNRKVVALRPDDIEDVLQAMAAHGYSARTMSLTVNMARRILRFGERRGVVIRNVAAIVEPVHGPVRTRGSITPDEARALLAAARSHRLAGLFIVSLLLGLRPGEAAGLQWDAVDLDSTPPTLTVETSLRRTAGKTLSLTKPKTASSWRTLALPPDCVTALEDQKRFQEQEQLAAGEKWSNPDRLVFTTNVGSPLHPSNVRRALQIVATKAGLGHMHPHLLRHAAASLMSDAGVRLEDIADTLGHRSVTITADIYRHPINATRTGHLDAMTALTGGEDHKMSTTNDVDGLEP
jgi:integrase